MAIKIKFDVDHNPETPTILLGKRSGKIIGQIQAENVHFSSQMHGADELSFTTHKWYNGAKNALWGELIDFRLIYVPEFDSWYEMYAQVNEDDDCTKNMTAIQLGYAELSQINVTLSVNTQENIDLAERLKAEGIGESYTPKKIYYSGNKDDSLLDLILKDKASHYQIMYVDPHVAELQRTFDFKDKSIWDCFEEISEEVGCYFDIVTGRDKDNGWDITRQIYVYDLNTTCNSCGFRGDFHNVCPECGSNDIHEPTGKDTTIFVSADELGDDIVFDTDEGSVKNCFKLEGGDDTMTAAIRSLNPNGSDYLWYFPQYIRNDMSPELQAKLVAYDSSYDYYQNNAILTLPNIPVVSPVDGSTKSIVLVYNDIVEKYTREINGTKQRLVERSQGGSVNLIKRPIIASSLLTNLGWTGITTALTAMYIKTEHVGETYANFTPIVYDEQTLEVYTLSPSDLSEYATKVINGTSIDNLKLQVGPQYIGANASALADAARIDILALCDIFYFGNNPDMNIEPIPIENNQAKIIGYKGLSLLYYNTVDFDGYLRHTMMPSVDVNDTTANLQMEILAQEMTTVAVEENISISSAQLAAESYAKAIVDQRYKVKLSDGSIPDSYREGYYYRDGSPLTVRCSIQSYSNDEDIAVSTLTITVRDSKAGQAVREQYIQEKIDKALAKIKADDYDITSLFNKTNTEFANDLKKYGLVPLETFYSCALTVEEVLTDMGIMANLNPNSSDIYERWNYQIRQDLYESSTKGLKGKLAALESEINTRTAELNIISNTYKYNEDGSISTYTGEDTYLYPVIMTKGIQGYVDDEQEKIRKLLNFKTVITDEYWPELSSFRREQTYKNSSFISDGLSNAELFERAEDYFKMAKGEIYKSAELQHTISATLKNLLVIEKFEPLVDSFELSNWLRIKVNDEVYRLRLIKYDISYDDLSSISVDFSDVIKTQDGLSDQQSIIKQASSVSSSYSYTQRQSSKGAKSYDIMNGWSQYGLDVTNSRIVANANNQSQTWDEHGMLFRRFEDEADSYNKEQAKMLNSSLVFTNDNWEHVSTAVGKFYYYDPTDSNKLKQAYGVNGQVIMGKILLGEELGIYNSDMNMQFNKNGLTIQSSDGSNSLIVNPNNTQFFSLNNKKFYINADGSFGNSDGNFTVNASGVLTAKGATIEGDSTFKGNITNGTLTIDKDGNIITTVNGAEKFKVTNSGDVTMAGSLSAGNGNFTADSSGNVSFSGTIKTSNIINGKMNISSNGAVSYAGSTYQFQILSDGSFTANNATLSGSLTTYNKANITNATQKSLLDSGRLNFYYKDAGQEESAFKNMATYSAGYWSYKGAGVKYGANIIMDYNNSNYIAFSKDVSSQTALYDSDAYLIINGGLNPGGLTDKVIATDLSSNKFHLASWKSNSSTNYHYDYGTIVGTEASWSSGSTEYKKMGIDIDTDFVLLGPSTPWAARENNEVFALTINGRACTIHSDSLYEIRDDYNIMKGKSLCGDLTPDAYWVEYNTCTFPRAVSEDSLIFVTVTSDNSTSNNLIRLIPSIKYVKNNSGLITGFNWNILNESNYTAKNVQFCWICYVL